MRRGSKKTSAHSGANGLPTGYCDPRRGFGSPSRCKPRNSEITKHKHTMRIEKKTANAVLQKSLEIRIGDQSYHAAPPSCATLIRASELVAELPALRLNAEDIASETLYVARQCGVLGDLVAVLILGAKGLRERQEVVKTRLWGLIRQVEVVEVDRQAELAQAILHELSPSQVRTTIVKLLRQMEVADFFGIITSLLEINLLRQTREVKTTASGQ